MKRTMAAYLTAAAVAAGLAAASLEPAACQTLIEDELVRTPVSRHPVEVEVWVDRGEGGVYRDGEEVRIRFRASRDCYLVIYDIDTEGFLSLLFPDDPNDDGFVEGGRVYRLPDPRARYELLAEGPPGLEYIAAVACVTPIAVRLPWYLAEGYEAYGYRGYDELEATVSDVGAIRGDPYVAMRDIAYDILPEGVHEQDYDTGHTYFHVGREHRHPRYLCYDCHGHVTWLDPYYDSCSVFEVRIDLDWHFVSHPTFCRVWPRYWYWRRYDCPIIYADYPWFWCSLYPRYLYVDYYWDGLYRIGHRPAGRRHAYVPPRYRGKPGRHARGYYGKRYRDPYSGRAHYGKGYRHPYSSRGGGRGGKDVDARILGKDGRRYSGRGKPKLPRDVKRPERLGRLDDVRIKSRPDVRGRGRGKPDVRSRTGGNDGRYRSRGKAAGRDLAPRIGKYPDRGDDKRRVKSPRKRTDAKKKPRLRIVKRSDRDKRKSRGEVKKSKSRGRSKAKVKSRKKGRGGSSKEKVKPRKNSRSKGKSKAKVSKQKKGKSRSKSKAKVSKRKSRSKSRAKKSSARSSKSRSGGKARKTGGRGKGSRSKKR